MGLNLYGRHVHMPTASQKPPTVQHHHTVVRVVEFWAMPSLYRVTQVSTQLPDHPLSVYTYAVPD